MNIIKGFGNLRCVREQEEALHLFSQVKDNKFTKLARDRFETSSFDVYFNPNSGYVFLSDEDYNTVMDNDGYLDLFISSPYNGEEGFFDELMDRYEEMHEEDKEYMRDIATDELKEKYPILLKVE